MATYEIGGVCVSMTEDQAATWNRGDLTDEAMAGATVSIPRRSRDLPYEDVVPLATVVNKDLEGMYSRYMEGMPANLTREDPYPI